MTSLLTELAALGKIAARLEARARALGASAGPSLLVLTDPVRAPDPVALDRVMPAGSWLVVRSYGQAPDLSGLDPARCFLVSGLPGEARACSANGVHWPNRHLKHRSRSRSRHLAETASAHSVREALRAVRAGVTCVLVSAVFASLSPSAGSPLGPVRLARMVRTLRAACPQIRVVALGGITARTARRLVHTGVAGVAGVGFGPGEVSRRPHQAQATLTIS